MMAYCKEYTHLLHSSLVPRCVLQRCGKFCPMEYGLRMSDSGKHAEYEEAMLAILQESTTCQTLNAVTAVKINVVDSSFGMKHIVPGLGPVPANPVRSEGKSGTATVEIDHVSSAELSLECHNVLIDAFDLAYEQVYGIGEMTNTFDTYETFSDDDSLNGNLGGGWYKWIYFPQWVSQLTVM